MSVSKMITRVVAHSVVFIGIPFALVYALNANYPGMLEARQVRSLELAMSIGIPIVIFYALADITNGWKNMIFEGISLSLVLIYTFLVMGFGQTHVQYKQVDIYLFYPFLMYMIVLGVAVRFPTVILRYLASKEEV